jgi:hypothetical protein
VWSVCCGVAVDMACEDSVRYLLSRAACFSSVRFCSLSLT